MDLDGIAEKGKQPDGASAAGSTPSAAYNKGIKRRRKRDVVEKAIVSEEEGRQLYNKCVIALCIQMAND